jgi:hypothetical protein
MDMVAVGVTKVKLGDELAGGLYIPFVLHARKVPRIRVERGPSPRLFKLGKEVSIDHLGLLFFRFRYHIERTLSLFR